MIIIWIEDEEVIFGASDPEELTDLEKDLIDPEEP